MAYESFQADSPGMKPRTEMAKPPNAFEDRLRQPAPAGPSPAHGGMEDRPHPGLNTASFRSHPFARMGGMGARAAMDRPQPAPQPPPRAPAYGVRSRQQGGMRQPMDYGRGAEESFRGASLTPPPTGMPGGIMGERNPMDRYREFAQGGGFNPLRERLMAQRGGMPPPAPAPPQWAGGDPRFAQPSQPGSANPFFAQMYARQQPQPPIQQERYQMPEQMYY